LASILPITTSSSGTIPEMYSGNGRWRHRLILECRGFGGGDSVIHPSSSFTFLSAFWHWIRASSDSLRSAAIFSPSKSALRNPSSLRRESIGEKTTNSSPSTWINWGWSARGLRDRQASWTEQLFSLDESQVFASFYFFPLRPAVDRVFVFLVITTGYQISKS